MSKSRKKLYADLELSKQIIPENTELNEDKTPDEDKTLYVGDMVIDVLAGKNAGVKTIAVTGGSSSKSELRKARPFKIIPNISKLPAMLGKI